jgi:CPA2 family monovalent cation:H+ antiporter-2
MIVAGFMTLLFRRLRQPPILGYLIAGVLIGPYTLPTPPVTDIHTISLLADLGLILLLFGLGLEFSWSKIRQIGLAVLFIGVVEILTMISIGYGIGQLMGWSRMDSIFLGAALHISSSAIIVKILRDLGRIDSQSTRLIVGILVVEDFAAVILLTLLSGIATTGTADLGDIGSLILRLVVFLAASLTIGTLIVPRLIKFVHRFRSRETLLIISLGLCFAMALIGEYSGLSVAAGAFIMGALIGDTEHSEEISEVVIPVRDMFAAIFFVTIGMLININDFADFIVYGIVIAAVFMIGKMFSNTIATFFTGHNYRTALEVGTGMPQMGEFSLAIAKLGVDRAVVTAPLYPVIAVATAITSVFAPFAARSSSNAADILERRAPAQLKLYAARTADWLQATRSTLASDSRIAQAMKHSIRIIFVNMLIVAVIISIGTISLHFVQNLTFLDGIRDDIIGLVFGFILLTLCVPSFLSIWHNVRTVFDQSSIHVLNRRKSARMWERNAIRIILRDSLLIILSIFVFLWFIPFFSGLFSIGSYAIAMPLFMVAIILYMVISSIRHIHKEVESNFSRVMLGHEPDNHHASPSDTVHGRISMLMRAFHNALRAIRNLLRRKHG